MTKLSICGHYCIRVLAYSDNGIHREFAVSGGAALLGDMLNIAVRQTSECRHEFAELSCYENENKKTRRFAISRRMGIRDGEFLTDSFVPELDPSAPLIVWDEGLGGIDVPEITAPVLWASNKALPDRDQFAKLAHNCFLFLTADVLRGAGAMISRQISWERSTSDLLWQLQNNAKLTYLLTAPHILVAFAEDGAVYIRRENGELKASIVLTHGGGEGTLREKTQGEIDDTFVLMTAALSAQFPDAVKTGQPLRIMPLLKAAEILLFAGYDIKKMRDRKLVSLPKSSFLELPGVQVVPDVAFDIPPETAQNSFGADDWCISNSVGGKHILDMAFDYVLHGAKVINGLPRLSFGALTTIDRWEIEAYQNIRNLILGYANTGSVKPLSIAVFGAPGSGKSFGVTQIAKNILPGIVETLEFNVSQFTGLSDLGAAFQKVRDVILEGKLPLVFFDEFDSDRDRLPLGWLKNFLMPMQDGKFKDENGEHPLGKCILVFAGGTSDSFMEFTEAMRSEDAAKQQEFKNVKGPDFVSRLKGTINVLGPNPKDENDKNYILRRAILLRGLCERKLKLSNGTVPVSKDVIFAMLLVPRYKHGARSMEAILDMSRLEGSMWEPASLPFYSQLELHVDAEPFVRLVLREVILSSYDEKLAQAIHEDFCKKENDRGNADAPYNIPWEQLPENIKDANRAQARDIAAKLCQLGYEYDFGDAPFPTVEELSEAEVLLLARAEHIRWTNERKKAGWTYGEERDDNKRIHPLLVEWDKLDGDAREKDKDAARNIMPLLKSVGLRVFRII